MPRLSTTRFEELIPTSNCRRQTGITSGKPISWAGPRLDPKPNAVYIVDREGVVASRVLWSNQESHLREGLEAVVDSRRLSNPQRQPRLAPMLRGVGKMDEILSAAGDDAGRDVLREVPPLYDLARLAGLFRPLPPLGRTIAALALTTAVIAGVMVGGLRAASRTA